MLIVQLLLLVPIGLILCVVIRRILLLLLLLLRLPIIRLVLRGGVVLVLLLFVLGLSGLVVPVVRSEIWLMPLACLDLRENYINVIGVLLTSKFNRSEHSIKVGTLHYG